MKTKNTISSILFLLFLSNVTFSQEEFLKIDSLIMATYNKDKDISISVGVYKNGTEFYTSYGNLSRENSAKVNEHSLFEIASITKILTSNLIAQAVIENEIKLDDFIDNYLPKQYQLHKNIQHKIKISDLASHQSGLPDIDFRTLITANPQQPTSTVNKELLTDLINNEDALLDYGNYRYSTIGYVLLGQILETIYNKTYAEIITEKIIFPLKMDRTFTTNFSTENKMTGYNPDGGAQEFFNWNIVASAGLVKSSAADMISYIKAVLDSNNNIGTAAELTETIFYNKDSRQLGLGINVLNEEESTVYAKTGDTMGQSSIVGYDRENNWGVVIFINQRNHKLRQSLFNEIYEIIKK
ncbi:serine hydrolase [uncultured Polaribacter sp.]|uniref:serine hydrolase domain-containing protein n=1 Tax=uncultured Polaribacter sp. TaxID=174711 RepID=UPI002621AC45|nr:serine hydrolase domain-containing protein [uncultured Polaribacter sp.]